MSFLSGNNQRILVWCFMASWLVCKNDFNGQSKLLKPSLVVVIWFSGVTLATSFEEISTLFGFLSSLDTKCWKCCDRLWQEWQFLVPASPSLQPSAGKTDNHNYPGYYHQHHHHHNDHGHDIFSYPSLQPTAGKTNNYHHHDYGQCLHLLKGEKRLQSTDLVIVWSHLKTHCQYLPPWNLSTPTRRNYFVDIRRWLWH